jgi:hypothetical protein
VEETTNDVYAADCNCVGEDCEGVLGGDALPGQPCDDGDPLTANDTWQSGCLCQGVVGVQENGGDMSVALYPNPTSDRVWLEVGGLAGERVSYVVSDLLGKRVLEADLGIRSGTWKGAVDLARAVPGVYILELRIGASVRTGRIIKY